MAKPLWTNFTDDEIKDIVKNATSFKEVQINLGYSSKSGSIPERLRKMFDEKGIDYSHFKGHAWNKKEVPLSDKNDFGILNKTSIRKILLEERPYKCEICGIDSWQGKTIALQVHHKDGDSSNNTRENLQLLCPNCHSQTDNWCHKNVKTKISDEEFLNTLKNSNSICEACRKLGITPNQSNYNRARKLLKGSKVTNLTVGKTTDGSGA